MPAQNRPIFNWRKYIVRLVTLCFSIVVLGLFIHARVPAVFAQNPLPTLASAPGSNQVWVYDTEVTEVGKNAERSRQFLFWVLTNPAIHSAPVITKIWAISRNIVYVFVVLVIVAFGLGLILSRRAGSIGPLFNGISSPFLSVNIPSILIKIGIILLYVTFSYVLVLGIIQVSEISMRFIKSLAGEELFNVIFAGSGNTPSNYIEFVGYKDANPNSLEMVKTSLTLIRLTSFTYNVMAVLLILRNIVLWFMLILSPFLALLMPFVFIRNTGFIWIGVFIQWLLYGPMVFLFLVALTNIWISGIPFPFVFTKTGCTDVGVPRPDCTGNGIVYRTSINILYGGPAQTLSAGNSANYIDTYAEYVIALVMLWASMILPWMLLRIFRDYCCELIAAGNNKLAALLDRVRQFPTPTPAPPSYPTSTTGIGAELPFRNRLKQDIQNISNITTHTNLEEIRDVTRTSTNEITKNMDLSVATLSDVSRLEINQTQRAHIQDQLRKIAQPTFAGSTLSQQKFSEIRSELEKRAATGDRQAAILLAAGEKRTEKLVQEALTGRDAQRPSVASSTYTTGASRPAIPFALSTGQFETKTVSESDVTHVASQTGVPQHVVSEVISSLSSHSGTLNTVQKVQLAQQTGVSETKIQEVINGIQSVSSQSTSSISSTISNQSGVIETNVKEIMGMVPADGKISTSTISNIVSQTGVSESKVQEVVSHIQSASTHTDIKAIAANTGMSETKVQEILHEIPSSGEINTTQIKNIAQKFQVSDSQVQNVAHQVQVNNAGSKSTQITASQIAQNVGVEEGKVVQVLKLISNERVVNKETLARISTQTQIPAQTVERIVKEAKVPAVLSIVTLSAKVGVAQQKIKEVVEMISSYGSMNQQSVTTVAKRTNLPASKIMEIMKEANVPLITEKKAPMVTVEDYEEVKSMWLTHYRNSPVPISETIKNRKQWLTEEEKKLTNISHLLGSSDPKLKQEGLEKVADILPFMLLGNFTPAEIVAYLKAKLEADKQIQQEVDIEEKVKSQVMAQVEEEKETLLTVESPKKQETEKHMSMENKDELPDTSSKK
jgi:hypothetical protein